MVLNSSDSHSRILSFIITIADVILELNGATVPVPSYLDIRYIPDVLQEPFRALYHPTIMAERPIFKWRHFAPEVILCAVRWYLRYSLSYREVQELLEERDLRVDHTTVWRWVQRYAPELDQRTRPHLKPTNKSWRVDETYVRIRGHWFYLYRALDSSGATIDSFSRRCAPRTPRRHY